MAPPPRLGFRYNHRGQFHERADMKRFFGRVLRSLALLGAAAVLIHVAAVRDMNRERRARRYLGDRLYTEVRGTGDPVVFLSGLEGSTRFWGHQFDDLAPTHRLIYVDELGFGRSPWPKHIGYTLDDQVSALRRTLAGLEATRRVTFVAHSFGTVLAAHYAARYPGDVNRLILLGTPVFDSPKQGVARIRQISALGAAFTFNRPLAIAACTTMCAFRPFLRWLLPKIEHSRPAAVVSDSVLHDLGSVHGSVQILLNEPIRKPLMTLGDRVVLIHGRQDSVTPIAMVESLARVSRARVIAIDSDHHHYLNNGHAAIAAEIIRR